MKKGTIIKSWTIFKQVSWPLPLSFIVWTHILAGIGEIILRQKKLFILT